MVIERFINAALYFAEKTSNLDTIKLYKLMFLADRDCIKKTGHTITESIYRKIQPWGPVPKEVKKLVDGMASGDKTNPHVSNHLQAEKQGRNIHISFKGAADLKYFTGEEINILENLARKYKSVPGKRIAHGVHFTRVINKMAWEKDFNMDVFLPPAERSASEENRAVANRFKMALSNV
jgi:hypothetical protein